MLTTTIAAQPTLHYIGEAYDLNSKTFLYTDEYTQYENIATVVYKDINKKMIAKKTIEFNENYSAPSFKIENLITGVKASVSVNKTINISYKSGLNKPTQTAQKTLTNQTVIDAGFHYYILKNWDVIINDQPLYMDYVSPSKQLIIPLDIRLDKYEVWNKKDTVIITISPKSFFFKLFVDPIILRYDRLTRQLLSYKGISNIKLPSGKKQIYMEIKYLD